MFIISPPHSVTQSDQIGTERLAYDTVNDKWELVRSGNVFIFTFSGCSGSNIYTITEQSWLPNVIARSVLTNADQSKFARAYINPINGIVTIYAADTTVAYFGEIVWTRY